MEVSDVEDMEPLMGLVAESEGIAFPDGVSSSCLACRSIEGGCIRSEVEAAAAETEGARKGTVSMEES